VRIDIVDCQGNDGEGAGFVAHNGTVITAAHVALKGTAPSVQDPRSRAGVRARLAAFDRANDVAVLFAPTRRRPTLDIARGAVRVGTPGAMVGFPGSDLLGPPPLAVAPIRFGTGGRLRIQSEDDPGPELATILRFTAPPNLDRDGFSGGPMVGPDGRVQGIVSGDYRRPDGRWQPFGPPASVLRRTLDRAKHPLRRTCRGTRGTESVSAR
jgi:S1-C subfamily serine protease